MKRVALILLAALATTGCKAFAEGRAPPASPGDIVVAAQWEMATHAAEQGDAEHVLFSLKPAMGDEEWPLLSKGKQYEVAELYGQAAEVLGRWPEAHLAFKRASELPDATDTDWARRMADANSIGQPADAWTAFEHFLKTREPILRTLGGRELIRFDAQLGQLPDARAARLALGREMEAEGRSPKQAYNDESIVWAHYAEALLESGDAAHAGAVAAKITDPAVMTELAADRRFDAIVAANPRLADPKAAAERYLAWARQAAKLEPRSLAARIAVIRALAVLDRPKDALAVVEETDRTMSKGARENPYFEDAPLELDVFQGWKGSLLVRAGRGPEAVAGLTYVASCKCTAMASVDLARALVDTGRAAEADHWLKDADAPRLTIEDQVTLAQTRVCVAAELGDAAGIEASMAFLREHRVARPSSLLAALVCANRLDTAASELAAQLADPKTRLAALGAAQVYADPVGQPHSTQLRARWAQLLARPDVRAAVEKVGRSGTFALQAREAHA